MSFSKAQYADLNPEIRLILLRWSKCFTPMESEQHALVERTIASACEDDFGEIGEDPKSKLFYLMLRLVDEDLLSRNTLRTFSPASENADEINDRAISANLFFVETKKRDRAPRFHQEVSCRIRRERVRKRFSRPLSRENMPPRPGTTSIISWVCFHTSNWLPLM